MDMKEAIQRVVSESKLSGAQLARDAGVSEDAFFSWTAGRRTPTPASIAKLAAGLERRADRLKSLARELREAP